MTVRVRAWLGEAWELVGADLPLFSLAAFLTITLSLCSLFILTLPLLAGLCIMFLEKLHGRPPELGHLWEGITQHFPASIAVYFVAMLASVPFDVAHYAMRALPPPWPAVGLLTLFLSLWLIGAPLFFALPLIADRDLSAREALRLSWVSARAQPWVVLLAVAVCAGALLLGAFACGFGLLITLPLVAAVLVVACRDVVGNREVPQMTSLKCEDTCEVTDDAES